MKRPLRSLRARLLLSHLAVVAVGVTILVVASNRLGPVFIHDHLEAMGQVMGGMADGVVAEFESGVTGSFTRALLVAAAASALVAVGAAAFASGRVLRPLEEVRRASRRLAAGFYRERVPVPQEQERIEGLDVVHVSLRRSSCGRSGWSRPRSRRRAFRTRRSLLSRS